jgi:Fe2+ or Zn2+ uptake regulation protein
MPQRLRPPPTTESNDLRNAGLKVTLPRLKILDILADSSARHMSAEDIYKKLLVSNEDIGLATVYRVLTQFEAAGLVTRHHFEGGMAVFELNQGAHHDHIVCVDCGRRGGVHGRRHRGAAAGGGQAPRLRDQRSRAHPVRALPQAELSESKAARSSGQRP